MANKEKINILMRARLSFDHMLVGFGLLVLLGLTLFLVTHPINSHHKNTINKIQVC